MLAKHAPLAVSVVLLTALAGCAAVPTIPEPALQNANAIQPIRVRGARGPLSQREANRLIARVAAHAPDAGAFDRHLLVEQEVAGTPLYTGNRVTILRDGHAAFGAIFNAIEHAQHYLYLEYFILQDVTYNNERLSDLLIDRHRQGVQIDIIYDDIGSFQTPSSFFQRLGDAGIHLQQFNPVDPFSAHFAINARDHRKILVADGDTAVIGGVNLSTDYEHTPSGGVSGAYTERATANGNDRHPPPQEAQADQPESPGNQPQQKADASSVVWHDTDLEIDGPAVVELKKLFEQHWRTQGGDPTDLINDPDPPPPRGDQVVRVIGSQGGQLVPRYYATLLSAIRTATDRIWITAAYFVPTYQELRALVRAARRGVDVRLLLPSRSDSKAALAVQHSNYGPLLRAGVKIYERDDGMLHSKTAVMDGVWSVVGSSNFDHRSVLFNDEVDAIVIGTTTGTALEQDFQQDLQHARPVALSKLRKRPFKEKAREQFWRLWQQLL
jgi:cardiolipin synthase A/B